MTGEELRSYPASPPGVAEWEELLIRLEIMPRALRATLDELPEDETAQAILRELLEREIGAGRWLEEVAGGGREPRMEVWGGGDVRWVAERFAAVRARNFAMVQRRGVEVWDWGAELADGTPATIYQVLSWLMASDAATLSALRETARRAPADRGVTVC